MMLKIQSILALEKYTLISSISKTKKLKMFYMVQLLCKKFNKKEKKQTLKLMKFKPLLQPSLSAFQSLDQ